MADLQENQTSDEKAREAQQKALTDASPWLREIESSEKHRRKFLENGRKINKRFLDKRESGEEGGKRMNLFTVNTEILVATLYSKFPVPVLDRRFKDADDDVARVAAMIMERNIQIKKRDTFDTGMKHVVQDWVLPGLGVLWWRYEPTIVKETLPSQEAVVDESGKELEPATPEVQFDRLINEEAISDYVFWEDFLWSTCRVWEECRWVARRLKFNKEDAEKRFGKEIAGRMTYTMSVLQSEGEDATKEGETSTVKYAEVFEIWSKRDKKVRWIQKGLDVVLDIKDDFLQLRKFWPCSKPLLAATTTTDLMPRADYLLTADQYEELDDLTNRIYKLEMAIKAVGIYDGQNEEIKRIFTEQLENTIIPTISFRDFAEKGGFKGLVDWLPIEAFANALSVLREVRAEIVNQIYELTGVSDIMRGQTKASETLGAQELKAQYGAVRTQNRQLALAAFVEENLEIKVDIIRNKYQPDTILQRSNILKTEDGKLAGEALKLIQSPAFDFFVEVAPDTMAIPEFNSERDARMAFMRSVAEILTAAAPITEQDPGAGVYILKMMQWAVAGFRVGRTIEGTLDEAVKALQKKLTEPQQPPPPPPEIETAKIKGQTDLETAKLKSQTDIEQAKIKGQVDIEIAKIKGEIDKIIAKDKAEVDATVERDKVAVSADVDKTKIAADTEREKLKASEKAVDIKPVIEAVQTLAENQDEESQKLVERFEQVEDLLGQLIVLMKKPRIKTAKRRPDGEIEHVREELEP